MIRPHRTHPLWYAFILHRVSGALLALFLPAHFWVLSMALNEAARLDAEYDDGRLRGLIENDGWA